MKVTNEELAWLAGIIDGEGHLAVYGHEEKGGDKKLKPRLFVSNSNTAIVYNSKSIMERLGASPYVCQRTQGKRKTAMYDVRTTRIESIILILDAVIPYLKGKQSEAMLLLDFCKKRKAALDKNGRNDLARYDEEDFEITEKMQEAANYFRSSQTTREEPSEG